MVVTELCGGSLAVEVLSFIGSLSYPCSVGSTPTPSRHDRRDAYDREAAHILLYKFADPRSIKAHFTSLISTISFTLYALLPTLEPQLFAAYPVESTSQALQAKTGSTGTNGVGSPTDTNTTTTTESTPADSLLLEHPDPASSAPASSSQITELGANLDESIISGATTLSVPTIAESVASVADSDITTSTSSDAEEHRNPAESWATEFTAASSGEHRDEDMVSTPRASAVSEVVVTVTICRKMSNEPTHGGYTRCKPTFPSVLTVAHRVHALAVHLAPAYRHVVGHAFAHVGALGPPLVASPCPPFAAPPARRPAYQEGALARPQGAE